GSYKTLIASPHLSAGATGGATLTADLTVAATTATVDSTVGYPSKGYLRIGDELVSYSGTTATTFENLQRGLMGTTDAGHFTAGFVLEDLVVHFVDNISEGQAQTGIFA